VVNSLKNLESFSSNWINYPKISENVFKSLGSTLRYVEIINATIVTIDCNAFVLNDTKGYNLRIVWQENDIDMSGENKCAFNYWQTACLIGVDR